MNYIDHLNKAQAQTKVLIERETSAKKLRILNRKAETIKKMVEDIGNGEKPFFQSGFLSTTRGKVQL